MIIDKRLEFADAVAFNTGGANTYNVGSLIDLGAEPTTQDLNGGADGQMYLVIQVDTTATASSTSLTLAFKLVSDATDTISTTTATVHYTGPALSKAVMVEGYRYCAVALPMGAYERYLAVQQVTAGEACTGGTFSAYLTRNPGKFIALPNAVGA